MIIVDLVYSSKHDYFFVVINFFAANWFSLYSSCIAFTLYTFICAMAFEHKMLSGRNIANPSFDTDLRGHISLGRLLKLIFTTNSGKGIFLMQ